MARSIRDAKLDSRAARERLSARGKPYFRTLDPGLHLGYRKLKGAPGRWVVRYYIGEQSYALETIATADDSSTANGVDVLDFRQAQEEARKRRDTRVRTAAGAWSVHRRRRGGALHRGAGGQGQENLGHANFAPTA